MRNPPFIKHFTTIFPKDKSSELECFANKTLAKPILIVKYPMNNFEHLSEIIDDILSNGVDGYNTMIFQSKSVDDIEFEVLNGNSNVDDKNIEVFKKDKWINAYNQKPLECRSCLICNKYNGHIKIGYFQSDTWFDSNSDIATVTHWMELPGEPV